MQNLHNRNLIFLPGWGFQASIWENVAKQMPDFECKLMHLPELASVDHVDAILQHLQSNVPEQSVMIGWSLGGLLASRFCYLFPNKVKQLILVNASPKFVEDENWVGISSAMSRKFVKHATRNLVDVKQKFFQQIQYPDVSATFQSALIKHQILDDDKLKFYLSILFDVDFRAELASLSMPIHVISGIDDPVVKRESIEQLKILNPSISITLVPNAGHTILMTHQEMLINYLREIIS